MEIFLVIYLICAPLAILAWAHDMISFGEAILWPVALAKALLKAAYVVLFTGWRIT